MAETIVVINQKGGVGKSTTVQALGAGLHARGKTILYIDLDAQGNLSDTLDVAGQPGALLEALQARQDKTKREGLISACILHTEAGDIIPYSPQLAAADIAIGGVGKELRLKEMLQPLQDKYDYILIDTPPALGILTVNALSAADGAVIPAQADTYSLHGIGQLYDTIETVKEYTNPQLRVLGIVLTRYNGRSILSREVAESMGEAAGGMDTRLCKSKIRECVALKEAQASRCDIFTYAPKSNAALDYKALLVELFGKEAKHGRKTKKL